MLISTPFLLARGGTGRTNTNPQDIANPPGLVRSAVARGQDRGPATHLAVNGLPPNDFDFAPVVVGKPR